jgi:adenylate kinase
MLNLIIFGAPGTGKGTQSANIAKRYHLIHLSTGDIMREEIKNGSIIGKLAAKFIDKGLLVPDSVILKQLYHKASEHYQPNGFIFDGFPRTIVQAEALDKMLNKKQIPVSMVIYLDVSEEELYKRIISRSNHSARSDDNEKVIRQRLEEYRIKTFPLLEYYDKCQKLYKINGMGSIEEVCKLICGSIDDFIAVNNIVINPR